jgi:hypothetical protein
MVINAAKKSHFHCQGYTFPYSENVSIAFRYGCKWQGTKVWHYCGTYPTNDMTVIRDERNKARDLVKAGIDPRANKKVVKIDAQAAIVEAIRANEQKRTEALTFNDLYMAWIKDDVNRSDGNKYITQSFGKYAIPVLAISRHDIYPRIICGICTGQSSQQARQPLRLSYRRTSGRCCAGRKSANLGAPCLSTAIPPNWWISKNSSQTITPKSASGN